MKMTVILIVIGVLKTIPKGLMKELEDLEIRGDHSENNIIRIGQNTEKSFGDLRKFSVKDHQLMQVGKTLKE